MAKGVAKQIQALNNAVVVYDKRRKQDTANKLMHRWLRWEISNFDYIMQVREAHLFKVIMIYVYVEGQMAVSADLCDGRISRR